MVFSVVQPTQYVLKYYIDPSIKSHWKYQLGPSNETSFGIIHVHLLWDTVGSELV